MAVVRYKALLLFALSVLIVASAAPLNITKRDVETVCTNDHRVLVSPNTSPPYSWIAHLTSSIGSCTAFMVNVPRATKQVVLTARHCLHGNPSSVTLQFPGKQQVTVQSNQIFLPPSSSGDYAAIALPTGWSDGFGYNAVAQDSELTGRSVTITGYPGEKPRGTMWTSGGVVSRVDNSKLYYRIDTTGGQSGSPIYTWWNGYWTVVGIHTNGGCGPRSSTANSGKHLTLPLLNDILTWASYPLLFTPIESVHFPNRFLRMDGQHNIVNVQYNAYGWEHFHILPVLVPNSLAASEEYDTAYAIESAAFSGRYLRMDGQGVTRATGPGGGTVNTQTNVYAWEMYRLVPQPAYGTNVYAIGSRHFGNVYLRMDGTHITNSLSSGGGVVNCQYGIDAWERFKIG